MSAEELSVPLLLGAQHDEEEDQQQGTAERQQHQQQEIRSAAGRGSPQQQRGGGGGDLEQGLLHDEAAEAAAEDEADEEGSNKAEDEAVYQAARASNLTGPSIYCADLARLALFYWAIVADALLLKELYAGSYLVLAGVSTGFTIGPHVLMSLLLIVRQGWLLAATQAVGFILTLNPFENLTPIPQGIMGLFVLSIGFIAYVLIAASGLIFVAYCVVCYLVTALLFSLLILDLAALVITVAPSKGLFKYTDLVYTENFKTSRLILQAWLQSAPELVVIGVILYSNVAAVTTTTPVVLPAPLLLQALAAHLLTLVDKTLLFRSCAAHSGCSVPRQLLLLLGIRASCRLSLPVLRENLSKVLRAGGGGIGAGAAAAGGGAGGGAGDGLGGVAAAAAVTTTTIHLSSAEDVADNDSDAAASMVPEYLTPNNGGLLSPGQMMGLSHAVFKRHGGPQVGQLVLELTPDVMVGKLLCDAVPSVPNVSQLRLVNAGARGADAAALATALLQLGSLRTLQLHQVILDERGAAALSRLLEATPTLQHLELCRCKLRRRAAVALSQGLRSNRTLRSLNLAGVRGLDDAGAVALAAAAGCSKALTAVNLAFVQLSDSAVDALIQAVRSSSSLRVLSVSQSSLAVDSARRLLSTVSHMACPKAPPSLSCNLNLGTFAVEGLDSRVQFLVVADQDSLIMDAWQGLAGETGTLFEEQQQQQGFGAAGGGGAAGADSSGSSRAAAAVSGSGAAAGSGSSEGEGEGAATAEVELEAAAHVPLLQPQQYSHSRNQQQQQPPRQSPAAAFGVVTPVGGVTPTGSPRAAAAAAGAGSSSSSAFAAVSALLPRATAAWVSGGNSSPSRPATPAAAAAAAAGSSGSSSSSNSKAAAAGRCPSSAVCPCLVFVVEQQECTACMVQAPLLFEDLDTLNLGGLGIGDEGAEGMAKTLSLNPSLRRCVLSDNRIGEAGGAALAAALAVNTNLQVLDLSSNEFSGEAVAVLGGASASAAGLRQLRLLGNKIPFGLETLRTLMQAESVNPACHLVLVEEPSEVLDALEASGQGHQVERAADFYRRQEQYRQQRRTRMLHRQQRLAQLQHKAAQQQQQEQEGVVEEAAAAEQQQRPLHSAWIASPSSAAAADGVDGSSGSSQGGGGAAIGITTEPSNSSVASIEGQPLRVVVHSPAAGAGAAAGAAGSPPHSSSGSGGGGGEGQSPHASGSGSLSSLLTAADEDSCGICFDSAQHVAIKYCGHRLCVDCYRRVWELSGGDSATCPFCRARLEGYCYLDWPLE